MSEPAKCPHCGASLRNLDSAVCAYCGTALPHTNPKFKTKSEELGWEINGLAFSTVVVLIITGIIWQFGLSKIALLMAIGWGLLLFGYSIYLFRRFGR